MRRVWGQSDEIQQLLLRIDWLSQPNGALLWWIGAAMARFGNLPLPGTCLGGAKVVRRMASRKP